MTEIKPCPMCGGDAQIEEPEVAYDAEYNEHLTGFAPCCTKCGLSFDGYFSTREDAAEKWNTRAEPSNPPLTESQIRGMVGRWVWYKSSMKAGWEKIIEIVFDEDPMAGMPEIIIFDSGEEYLMDMLGIHYNLYHHQPEAHDGK